ncbi:MAG: DegT/DnrJ/EryC1/StrS family aminotransferase [Planctomycetota bacterium]
MKVPMLDLRAQYATIKQEVVQAVGEVLDSQLCCNGPDVREFESEMAKYCDCARAVGVSSGTDALLCSLMALEIGDGDEVVTTPFTFFGTAGAIWRTGARPVFADIRPETFNLDPEKVADAVTDRTKAIMPVHLFGQMVQMDPLLEIARERGLYVIEDAAQAIGATQNGRKAASLGTTGCLSFYPTKNLGAMGDAGMITTQEESLAGVLESVRNHGQGEAYFHPRVGGNFRMDSVQAAVLSVKLRRLDDWTAARQANAARYDELLADCEQVVTPAVAEGNTHIYHQYTLRARQRDELRQHLSQKGVAAGVYYPLCLHQQECFASLGYSPGDFPAAEQAAAEVISLPVHPELTDEQVEYVAESICEFYG